jgi:uncharacterized protein
LSTSESGESRRLRLFIDANVLVSAAMFTGPEHRLLAETSRSSTCVAVVSEYALREVRRVLQDKFGLVAEAVEDALATMALAECAEPALQAIEAAGRLLRDPRDAPILAAAWEAGVDALVTGDRDFLEAQADLRIRVLRTADALALLQQDD